MGNIEIIPDKLQEHILVLQNDSTGILDTIKNINDSIKALDETIWKSPEKTKMDQELIPFIDSRYILAESCFNNCINVLNAALNRYIETNNNIIKGTSSLETYDNMSTIKSNVVLGEHTMQYETLDEDVSDNREVL